MGFITIARRVLEQAEPPFPWQAILMTTPREVAARFVERMNAGRLAEAFGMLNEHGRMIIIGSTPVSGTFHGRAEMQEKLYPFMQRFSVLPKLTVHESIIEGNRVVLLGSGVGEATFGTYAQPRYAWVMRVSGDGFDEIVEFMDTMMVETAVYGRKLKPRDAPATR